MFTVTINGETRDAADVPESWINQQISRRRDDALPVCVRVAIKTSGVDVVLATPGCGSGGFGGRQPKPNEAEIIELWRKRGLNDPEFSGGNLVAFLKQLSRTVPA
jgi:hypothetical protein